MPYYTAKNIRWTLELTPCNITYSQEGIEKTIVVEEDTRAIAKVSLETFIKDKKIQVIDGIEISCIGEMIPESQKEKYFNIKEEK